jgi:hypothetical protein
MSEVWFSADLRIAQIGESRSRLPIMIADNSTCRKYALFVRLCREEKAQTCVKWISRQLHGVIRPGSGPHDSFEVVLNDAVSEDDAVKTVPAIITS